MNKIVLLLTFLILHTNIVLAEVANEDSNLSICTGYHTEAKYWGYVGSNEFPGIPQNCPEGYAFFSAEGPVGRLGTAGQIPISGACCPLPKGVLLNQHIYSLDECPENYVATGARKVSINDPDLPQPIDFTITGKPDHYYRCSAIDSSRYMLGPMRPGATIGTIEWLQDLLLTIVGKQDQIINIVQIPPALRYGILRKGWIVWTGTTCLGYPLGSILVKKTNKRCTGFMFRELQYKGLLGDPPPGTPVKIFPDCLAVSDPLDTDPKCIR